MGIKFQLAGRPEGKAQLVDTFRCHDVLRPAIFEKPVHVHRLGRNLLRGIFFSRGKKQNQVFFLIFQLVNSETSEIPKLYVPFLDTARQIPSQLRYSAQHHDLFDAARGHLLLMQKRR